MSESLNLFERIAHSLIFGQKTSDSLGKSMSEFPALPKWMFFPKAFLQMILVDKWLVRHSSTSPNQQLYTLCVRFCLTLLLCCRGIDQDSMRVVLGVLLLAVSCQAFSWHHLFSQDDGKSAVRHSAGTSCSAW